MTPAPGGTLTLTLLIDVGERIDLALAEARVQSTGLRGQRAVLRRTEAKGSIRIPVPPLILDLSEQTTRQPMTLPEGWSETLHVAVYDFGVLSCRRILSWDPAHTWASLVPVIADLHPQRGPAPLGGCARDQRGVAARERDPGAGAEPGAGGVRHPAAEPGARRADSAIRTWPGCSWARSASSRRRRARACSAASFATPSSTAPSSRTMPPSWWNPIPPTMTSSC